MDEAERQPDDSADESIVLGLDHELRHVHASAGALAMVGLPREALVGRTSTEAGLPTEVVEPLERELRRVVAEDAERHLELQMPTSDGVRWLHLRLMPGGADDPERSAVTIVATDITARKHAELRLSAGNAAFHALVEDSPDPVALIDADLRIMFINSALERVTGRPAPALLGRPVTDAGLDPELARRLAEGAREVLESGERLELDFRVPGPDGARWFSGRLLPEAPLDGRTGHVILVGTDVTDRVAREAEQAALRRVATVVAREADLGEIARVVAQEASLLLGASGSAVYRFESEGWATCVSSHPVPADSAGSPAVFMSPATATGRTAITGAAARVDDYNAVAPDESVREVLQAGLRSGIACPLWAQGRLWGALTAGSTRRRAFGDADQGRLEAFAELASIAVANAESRRELDRLADTDPLTNLANRRAFTSRLDGEVERARRHGHALSLAILDLDHFKRINDTKGHQVGDAVLAEVGRRLAETCRSGEVVARIGGEEFAWILPLVNAGDGATAVERARAAIGRLDVSGVRGLTCSAGICDLRHARDAHDLMRRADRALYAAKNAGRDRIHVAD